MRFYYTGAQQYLSPQPEPTQALGGYPSASLVANDQLEAVFSACGPYARQQGLSQVRCLALLNETGGPISGLRVNIADHPELAALAAAAASQPAPLLLEVGLALPNVDRQANPYFEQVPDAGAAPYYATFGPDVRLGTPLEPGEYVGVWLRLRPQPATAPTPAALVASPVSPYLPQLLCLSWS